MPLSPPVQVHQATAARASARLLNGLVVQGRGDTLQAEPCGEQPLDDVIMQVTGDAPPIYQDTEPLLIGSSVAEFQSDGRLTWCARGVDLACVKINEPKPRRPSLIMYRLQSTNVSIKASTRL